MTMSRFRDMPRREHIENVKGIFSYLNNFKDASIVFNTEKFDHSMHPVKDHEWKYIYGNVKEDLPKDAPAARGNSVAFTSFCDANLLHDLITGRSVSGIMHMVNCTLMDWFSKRQNQVESAVYGSEFMAGRLAVEQIMELRYMFVMLGVPIDGPTYLFGDNMSMVTSSTVPSSSLKKRHNILSYHCVREAVAADIVRVIHIPGTENPADVLTKSLGHGPLYKLTKRFIFYNEENHPKSKDEGEHQVEDPT